MTSKKPVIGIILDLVNNNDNNRYSIFPWYALRQNYAESVLLAGGIPLMIPYQDDVSAILQLLDGLVLAGGDEDIHPKFYNHEITSQKTIANDARDNFEVNITKKAIALNMPILGICRGMQLLNIVFGGTLMQHIPDYLQANEIKSLINHEQPTQKHSLSHAINIKPLTILAQLAGDISQTMVNSTHHQAVWQVGEGMIVSATAADGIIEAIESINHKFIIGVEWHPEYLNDNGLDGELFKALIEATQRSVKQ